MYNGDIILQIYGTAMGNIASGIISNLIMDDLLDNCLKQLSFETIFIKKYVDDLITLIPEDKVNEMREIMNSSHAKLKFTIEK